MSDNPSCVPTLWTDSTDDGSVPQLSDSQRSILLEQYKLYIEMTDRVSARRDAMHSLFLTLHSLFVAGFGYLARNFIEMPHKVFLLLPLLAFCAFCYAWWRLVKSYRQLNTAKFKVIAEMERALPASPWHRGEWKSELAEGKDPKKYVQLTIVESLLPALFAIVYVLIFLFILTQTSTTVGPLPELPGPAGP